MPDIFSVVAHSLSITKHATGNVWSMHTLKYNLLHDEEEEASGLYLNESLICNLEND